MKLRTLIRMAKTAERYDLPDDLDFQISIDVSSRKLIVSVEGCCGGKTAVILTPKSKLAIHQTIDRTVAAVLKMVDEAHGQRDDPTGIEAVLKKHEHN